MPYLRGLCNFCGTGCGHFLRVENNRVRGVYPLPGHPLSKGRLCVRGWHIHELLQTEERITQPQIKYGDRFKRVSLEEAISFVAEKLKSISGQEIAFLGSPRASNEDNYLFGKFARAVMKSNNLSLSSDAGQEESAITLLQGAGWPAMLGSMERLRQADFILVVGGDLTKQNPIIASEIHYAHRAGAELVTISARKTQMAKLSQIHLRPEPGTASRLLEAMAKVLVDEGRIAADFISRYTEGSEKFLKYLESLSLQEIAHLTGVEIELIRTVALKMAEAESAYAFYATGIQSLDHRTMAALFNLYLLAGKLGRPDCGINPVTGISNLLGSYDMGVSPAFLPGYFSVEDKAAWKRLEEHWQIKLNPIPGKSVSACLSDDSSCRVLFVVDHDEEIIRNVKKIKELDLVVYFGAYENAFARLANVIFPLTTYVESDGTYTNCERRVQLSQKKVEPPAESRPLWEILTLMAKALGHNWTYRSAEEVMTEINRVVPQYAGITYGKLRTGWGLKWPCDEQHPSGTDSLLAEEMSRRFCFILNQDEKLAFLPRLQEKDQYPLKLVVGRSNYFWHQNSIMKKTFIPKREYNALLLLYPKGFVEISEEEARRLGLREKQQVRVVSEAAEIKLAVRISPDILPGMLYIPYFIDEMIPEFLHRQVADLEKNEEFFLPVRLEKVE
ncbi:MAG: molybdopterin-dependent oxidoreductase [Candidatus Aminicenantes bacterium]|nr:molybdopterin-dependent oxidoreductase [Candidatus Aminicenantes bacterium]